VTIVECLPVSTATGFYPTCDFFVSGKGAKIGISRHINDARSKYWPKLLDEEILGIVKTLARGDHNTYRGLFNSLIKQERFDKNSEPMVGCSTPSKSRKRTLAKLSR